MPSFSAAGGFAGRRKRHGTCRTNQIITEAETMQDVFRALASTKQESFVYGRGNDSGADAADSEKGLRPHFRFAIAQLSFGHHHGGHACQKQPPR